VNTTKKSNKNKGKSKKSQKKRGKKNAKKSTNTSGGFSISVDSVSACKPVPQIIVPIETPIPPGPGKRTKKQRKVKTKPSNIKGLPSSSQSSEQAQQEDLQQTTKDAFPPYDDKFTFDIFSSSIEDLLMIFTPTLYSLTEKSLEETNKEIEMLEEELTKVKQEASALGLHLSTLQHSFVSI